MKYTYPDNFDNARAQELGQLVNAAYAQLDQGTEWQPPAGYRILEPRLSTREVWKAPGQMLELITHLIPPVPFGFLAARDADVYVVIRGTKTPLEWLDDFTAQPVALELNGQPWGHVTLGFKLLFDDLGPQIIQALTTYQAGGGALDSIYVTGHSLGAALAHLAAAGISAQFGVKPVSYTFCGPRTGDTQFAATIEATQLQTWRIFNTEDIVPTAPPAAVQIGDPSMGVHGLAAIARLLPTLAQLRPIGYQHIGYPIAATFHSDSVAGNHSLSSLCQEIAR